MAKRARGLIPTRTTRQRTECLRLYRRRRTKTIFLRPLAAVNLGTTRKSSDERKTPYRREPRRHSVVDKLQEVARKESRDRAGPRPRKGLLILLILVTTAVSLGIVIGLTEESPLRVIPEMVVLLAVLFIGQGGAWLVYEKADISGWLSLVPVVNVWYLHEIAGVWKPLIVVWLIPFLNLIIMFVVFYGVARNFGRGVVFALGRVCACDLLPHAWVWQLRVSRYLRPNSDLARQIDVPKSVFSCSVSVTFVFAHRSNSDTRPEDSVRQTRTATGQRYSKVSSAQTQGHGMWAASKLVGTTRILWRPEKSPSFCATIVGAFRCAKPRPRHRTNRFNRRPSALVFMTC